MILLCLRKYLNGFGGAKAEFLIWKHIKGIKNSIIYTHEMNSTSESEAWKWSKQKTIKFHISS